MSRSRKKLPICGMTTADSEKDDKLHANRRLRYAVRRALAANAEIMPKLREVSNVWSFAKDGKQFVTKFPEIICRK